MIGLGTEVRSSFEAFPYVSLSARLSERAENRESCIEYISRRSLARASGEAVATLLEEELGAPPSLSNCDSMVEMRLRSVPQFLEMRCVWATLSWVLKHRRYRKKKKRKE